MMDQIGRASLYFAHIPKTAGTTYRYVLEDAFDHEDVCQTYFDEESSAPVSRSGQDYRFYRSHARPFARIASRGRPLLYACLTRDPVARFVSMVAHILRERGKNPFWGTAEYTHQFNSLSEAVWSEEYDHLKNMQFWWIAKGIIGQVARPPISFAKGMVRDFISRLFLPGTDKRLRESCLLAEYALGQRPRAAVAIENPGDSERHLAEFDEEARSHVSETHELDHKVCAWMEERLETRLQEAMRANMVGERALEILKHATPTDWMLDDPGDCELARRAYGRYLARRASGERVTNFSLSAADRMNGAGWHRREYAVGVSPYRWSGPSTKSDIDLPAPDGAEATVVFEVAAWSDNSVLQGVKGCFFGEPVKVHAKESKMGGASIVLRGRVPAIAKDLGFLRVGVEAGGAAPLIVEGPDSNRIVGFAWRSVLVMAGA